MGDGTRKRGRARQRGLTLVELLVCACIIAVLTALLLPSLQQARQLSSSIGGCTSNLRRIGQAMHLYFSDHNELIPPPGMAYFDPRGHYRDVGDPNVGLQGWAERLVVTGVVDDAPFRTDNFGNTMDWTDFLTKTGAAGGIFRCPNYRNFWPASNSNPLAFSMNPRTHGYGIPRSLGMISGTTGGTEYWHRASDVVGHSGQILATDGEAGFGIMDPDQFHPDARWTWDGYGTAYPRHGARSRENELMSRQGGYTEINALFLDGHVELGSHQWAWKDTPTYRQWDVDTPWLWRLSGIDWSSLPGRIHNVQATGNTNPWAAVVVPVVGP